MPNRASSRLVTAKFSEELVRNAAQQCLQEVDGHVSCAFAFVSPDYLQNLEDFLEIVRVDGHAPVLLGCTGGGLIGTGREAEQVSGFSLLFLNLPQTEIRIVELAQDQIEES